MAGLPEQVPEGDRVAAVEIVTEAELGGTFAHLAVVPADGGQAGKIPLDVGQKNRHPTVAERLGQNPQRHGLAGAGGSGDQAVAVGHAGEQVNIVVSPCQPPGAVLLAHIKTPFAANFTREL